MQTITLEEHLIDAASETTKVEASPLLSNLEIELNANINSKTELDNSKRYIRKISGIYGGVFSSLLLKCDETNSDFARIYSSYIASSIISSLMKEQEKSNISFNIPFSITDRTTLMRTIGALAEHLQDSYSYSAIKRNSASFFSGFIDYTLSLINSPEFSELKNKYSDCVVKGPNFEINGLEKQLLKEKQTQTKSILTPHNFNLTSKEQIVGNVDAIKAAELSVNCLMHYSNEKNPFLGFNQFLAFLGEPGTGKTMVADYAMSLAKKISEKNNIPISISELNFESQYQYGPLINLRDQLRQITDGDKIHIIFMDEFDSKLPARNQLVNSSYKNEVVGEFLRFRGGAYQNKGNYLFLITSNQPDNIDSAIFRVFHPVYVSGPRTTKERLEVLQKNLARGTEIGYVQIKDWANIMNALEDTSLTGSDLNQIALNAEERFRLISSKIPFNLSLEEKTKIIKDKAKDYLTTEQDVLRAISQQQYAKELNEVSYVK
jgi:hypothetical protein